MEYQQTENIENNPSNLLGNEAALINTYDYASTGQRFLNFFIDNLVMNYGLSYLTGYAVGLTIGLIMPDVYIEKNSAGFFLLVYSIAIMNYLLYYILSEKLFNGYTLGKLITGTKAVREDGTALTLKDVFIRTLCRLVPFETLSGFKIRPWHDEWSKTMVIKAR